MPDEPAAPAAPAAAPAVEPQTPPAITESEADAPADVQSPGEPPPTGPDEWTPDWRQQQAAKRSGLTDEQVSGLVESMGAEAASDFLDQRADQHDALSRQAREFAQAPEKPPAGAKTDPGGVPDGDFSLSPESLDKTWENGEAVAAFMQPVVAEINSMRKALRDVLGQVQTTSDRNTAMTADTFFASLGDDFADVFGTGPTNVSSMEPHQQARLRVMSAADRIAAGYKQSGNPIHQQEALQRALSMEMGEKLGTIARSRKQARLKKRAGQTQAGPGGRRPVKPKTREERKAAFLQDAEKIRAGGRLKR